MPYCIALLSCAVVVVTVQYARALCERHTLRELQALRYAC